MHEYPYVHEMGKLPPTLAQIEFLSDFDQSVLDGILGSSSLLEVMPGEEFVQEGENSQEFYLLLKGTIQIVKSGKQIALISKQGDILGEASAFKREARTASLVAVTRSFLLKVDPAFVDKMSPVEKTAFFLVLYRFLAEVLAKRLEETSARLAKYEGEG